jgi:hypothetical protein
MWSSTWECHGHREQQPESPSHTARSTTGAHPGHPTPYTTAVVPTDVSVTKSDSPGPKSSPAPSHTGTVSGGCRVPAPRVSIARKEVCLCACVCVCVGGVGGGSPGDACGLHAHRIVPLCQRMGHCGADGQARCPGCLHDDMDSRAATVRSRAKRCRSARARSYTQPRSQA